MESSPSSDGNKGESLVFDVVQLGIDFRDSDVNLFRHWIEKLQVTGHSCTKLVTVAPHKLMSHKKRSWSGQKIQIQISQFNETCFLLLCWVFCSFMVQIHDICILLYFIFGR